MKCACHLLRWMADVCFPITGNGRIKLGSNRPQHLLQLAFTECFGKNATSTENCDCASWGSFPKEAVFTSEVSLPFWLLKRLGCGVEPPCAGCIWEFGG